MVKNNKSLGPPFNFISIILRVLCKMRIPNIRKHNVFHKVYIFKIPRQNLINFISYLLEKMQYCEVTLRF